MAKFMNIVRCKVKSSSREEYLKKLMSGQSSMGRFQQSTLKLNLTNFL